MNFCSLQFATHLLFLWGILVVAFEPSKRRLWGIGAMGVASTLLIF